MNSGILFSVLVSFAIAAVVALRYASRRRVAKRHLPLELEVMHSLLAPPVSFKTFSEVLGALGSAYALDPRTIRPEDPLKVFLDLDSWNLGAGTEKLDSWMANAGVVSADVRPATVLDLLLLIENRRGSSRA